MPRLSNLIGGDFMETILRGLLVMATAGALVFPSVQPAATSSVSGASRGRVVAPVAPITPTAASFASTQVEAYLSDDGIAYIRPGLKLKINSITNVVAGQKPVVDFSLTDSFDQPLDRNGKVTPGPIAPGFILSKWNADTRYYKTYTLRTRNGVTAPAADQGGTYQDLDVGHYKYTFGTAMPAEVTASTTLTLGVYARRTLADIIGKDYYADNVLMDFRPDGATPDKTWGAMAVATTCNKCHDPLGLHGGTRRDVELCMQCHNNQINSDATSGQTFNGKVFFHKLHMGANLPSVVAGGTYYAGGDWSTVGYPQDIRNCTTCHEPTAAEAAIWYTRPTRDVCGSCHDNINWTTGANHAAGPMADDSACAKCHQPAGSEFDPSIQGAHVVPLKSKQLKGIKATIVSVSNFAPGKKPTVVFNIDNADGTPVDGTKVVAFSPKYGGPTTSYAAYVSQSGLASGTNPGTYDATTGYTSYTFSTALPADAKGTWAVTVDIERAYSLVRGDGKTGQPGQTGNESPANPVKYVSLDASPVTARRTVVTITQCNVCHDSLALHGGQRLMIEECVICHNPVKGDEDRRGTTNGAPESVSFQRLIHRIHTGENLTQAFTVIGFGGSVNNFADVRFPGDTQNCAKCHTANSYKLPLSQTGIAAVKTLRDYFSPQGPGTAACLGCHDNVDAAAHAYLNTTNFGGTASAEACATCHGTGKDWDVSKVHAR
jgi:OmcA/MtrC family decaheme c-type cytochrome